MSLRSYLGVLKKLGNSAAKQVSEDLRNVEAVELHERVILRIINVQNILICNKDHKKRKLFDLSY